MVCPATPTFVQTSKKCLWVIWEVQSEPILKTWGNIRYWPKRALLCKKEYQKFYPLALFNPFSKFLSVLHENKALHNFHEWRGTVCDCRMHRRSRLGPGNEIETILGYESLLISVALKAFSSILYTKTYQKNALHQLVCMILWPLTSQEVSNGCLHLL